MHEFHSWTGSDDREFGSAGPDDGDSVASAFWRLFRYMQQRGQLEAFFDIHAPLTSPTFQRLVCEARAKAAAMKQQEGVA